MPMPEVRDMLKDMKIEEPQVSKLQREFLNMENEKDRTAAQLR